MRVEVRVSDGAVPESLELHILRSLAFAVRGQANHVQHILVSLVELNGSSHGKDTICTISARFAMSSEPLVVEATDSDPYVAITRAGGRLDDRVAHAFETPLVSHEPDVAAHRLYDVAPLEVGSDRLRRSIAR